MYTFYNLVKKVSPKIPLIKVSPNVSICVVSSVVSSVVI